MSTLRSDAHPDATPRAASPRSYRLNEIGLLVAIVALYIALSASAAGFLTAGNQLGILRDAATIGIAAWGVTLVIIAGDIDISIGPAVAFSSVLVAKGSAQWGLGIGGAIVLTLVLGTLWGAVAGYLRARFDVPSFITTLGLWSILGGLALYMTDALPVVLPASSLMEVLGGDILGVPTSAIIMLVLFAVFAYVAKFTAYGRSVYAIGGNAAAAMLAGINLTRTRVILFATTGLLSAVTGILVAARLGSGNGGAAGGLEFDVIAAVVIGGTLLAGGRGSLVGTLLGVVFITVIANGLVLLGIDSFLQEVVRGVIIVGAVLINVIIGRRRNATRTT
ncbi:ABC transporter permease [Mycolicibacterium smegmatis]|uniref:Ribose transport system permease protein RbsC n=2 Tax=Mycolicibacterium smegmatis (strain ATCC 700084 / mc(2)155) TaxID=246196 RepID=A0QZE9_MYCS2|nr:ABC transporter permease [Mycolicibacterium smegmatis]ABK71867.1 ribose transport system permease protein RbsC [Mycolicibacterium smegmatis MC2 155]AFP40367.1 Permease protein of sugar ABC transporter [Mycolicibacterium smegmatis MC2 155]AIU09111.1 sugar ABC transporter permease [Mycolicibacterium smegmatis MC2 155]AIU15736.1 sugar ABC transporter permease [Mycolicibacterium smegmatis]AIU22359.1 sugar ABC transporter permease [Mycolicibacterium smegmatis]